MTTRTLTIETKPEPKQRPRLSYIGGKARIYTPAKTARYERMIRRAYAEEHGGRDVFVGAVSMQVLFSMPMPVSWSKKRKEKMYGKPHTQSPDLDNLVKAVMDGLDGALSDDAQVVDIDASKRWSKIGFISIEMEGEC